MKLFIEKNPELARLSYQFKKIEALADKFGINLNDLCMEDSDLNFPEEENKEAKSTSLQNHRIRLLTENNKKEKTNTVSNSNVKLFVSK